MKWVSIYTYLFNIFIKLYFRIMSAGAVQKLSKPQLRGLFIKNTKFHIYASVVLSIACGLGYKYGVGEPRKKAYAEFYK